jgi:cell division septal protein FtsQ
MRNRSVFNSPYLKEAKKKKQHVLRNRTLLYTFLSIAILVGVVFLLRWNKLLIQTVQVSGAKTADSGAMEAVVKNDIAGRYLWVFPKSNFLIYPKSKIKADLAKEFPVLKNISISVNGSQTLSVTVDERQGKYMWCGNDPATTTAQSRCYFMDDSGYIFGPAPYFSGSVYFKFFGNVGSTTPSGVDFFPDIFSKLVSFQQSAADIGVNITSILAKDNGDIEFYLASSVPPPNGPKILINTDADLAKEIQNLQAALATDPLQTNFKTKYSSLQYIDLRYGDKVYYKFSTGGVSAPVSAPKPTPKVPQNG